jgi:nitrite reductase/ring-hydroxylating ferredoxin subunit
MWFLRKSRDPGNKRHSQRSEKLGKKTPKIQVDSSAYSVEDNTIRVMLDKVPELSPVGGAAAIVNDASEVYLIIASTAENEYTVVSSQCTHRERPLVYDHEANLFRCASRKTAYRPDGSIVKGPVEIPLRVYRWQLHEGCLVIDLSS